MESYNETNHLKLVLKKKGWKMQEINSTVKTLTRLQKDVVGQHLNHLLYWSSLLLLGFTNLAGLFVLLPAVITLSGWRLMIIIFCTAISFGFIFNHFILSLEHFERKHHIIAGIFIPIIAVLDVFVLLSINEFLKWRFNQFNLAHKDIAIDIVVFVVGFLLPYCIYVLLGKHKLS